MNDTNNVDELNKMEKDILNNIKNIKADSFDDFIIKINQKKTQTKNKDKNDCIIY